MSSLPVLLCTCTILCLILASNSEAKPPRPPTARKPPHHSWLVYTWPFAHCSKPGLTKPCKLAPLPKKLVLHGLWPVDDTGRLMMDCQAKHYIGYVFGNDYPFYLTMEDHWPALSAPAKPIEEQIWFWSHEYAKHGSCFPAETPKRYLSRVINLKTKIRLYETLLAEKITPGTARPRSAYETAVRAKLGSSDMMMMRCYERKNQKILEEIAICIDGKGVAPVPCSSTDRSTYRNTCGMETDMITLLDS